MKAFIKKPIVIVSLVIIAGIIVVFGFLLNNDEAPETVTVKLGMITEEVSVTGKTKPVESIELAFKNSGKVASVLVETGEKVNTGQLLIQLQNNELIANRSQKQAALEAAEAKLVEIELDKNSAYQNSVVTLQDAFIKSDDAIKQKTDDVFLNDNTQPVLSFITLDSQAGIDAVAQRLLMIDLLNQWRETTNNLSFSSPTEDIDKALEEGKANLETIRLFLKNTFDAVNFAANLDSTTKNTYQKDLTTARTNVNKAFENITGQAQDIATQKAKIISQQAQINQLKAESGIITAQLTDTILRSPINGIVSKVDTEVGEVAQTNQTIIVVISENDLEIEANISEVDITKLKIGNIANLTLDAFGSDVYFEAKVIFIDPAETVIEGVATYKTKLQFIKEESGIKPGMTANIDILTDRRENVLVLPQRVVTTKGGKKTVKIVKENGVIEEVEVETGIRGSGGNIEIISGVKEGDKVLTQ